MTRLFSFDISRGRRPKGSQSDQEKKLLGLGLKIGCCRVSHFIMTPQAVGWVECNETRQSLASTQPNLRKAMRIRIELNKIFEVKFHTSAASG